MLETAHVHGLTDIPLIDQTIGARFDAVSDAHPDALALVSSHQNRRRTWGQMRARVDALASGLLALGLEKGDRVGIWAPNCEEWALTQFATAKAGLILVNVNPAYRLAEIEYAITKVGMRALVTAARFKSSDYVAMLNQLEIPGLEHRILIGDSAPGFLSFEDLLQSPLRDMPACDPDEAINIQFTSGTTGAPKGATLTHRNILNNGFFVGRAIGLSQGDAICVPVPLYHCFGMVMGNLAALTHVGAVVYPSDAFDPQATLSAIQAESCAAIYGVPTMFLAMLDAIEAGSFDMSSLRTGIMAGSPCPIEVMKRVISEMNCHGMTIAYGMTETSPVSFQSALDDSLDRRVTTVGRIQPHAEVKVVDAQGATVKTGETGELCTRGYLVMQGYWDDPEKTAEAIDADGFMHTGDLGVIDAQGYCNISGRTKDMVIRGGENIYPREVEEFLYRHPKITDVQVIGVPDAKYGEVLCACVIPSEPITPQEVQDFCKGQIAHYKIPAYVETMQDYPLTVTGKVQKYILRQQVAAKLGL